VFNLTEDDLLVLASESEQTFTERARCEEKLKVLEEGLRELRRLYKHRLADTPGGPLHPALTASSPRILAAKFMMLTEFSTDVRASDRQGQQEDDTESIGPRDGPSPVPTPIPEVDNWGVWGSHMGSKKTKKMKNSWPPEPEPEH